MRNLARGLVTLVIAGCSGVAVRSTPSPGVNLAALRTFAFMTPARPDAPAAQLARSPAGQQIRDGIAQNLVDKGYMPAPAGAQPDFLVAYRGVLKRRTDVHSWGYDGPAWGSPWGWGWGWGWRGQMWHGPELTVRNYTEGTLVVDFVDATSQRVLWRGTATGVVERPENPDLHKVAKVVDKLMDRYPESQLAASDRTRM
jgi:hypothetical protein